MRQNQPFSVLPEIKKGAVVTAQWLNDVTSAINRSNTGIRPPYPSTAISRIKGPIPQINAVFPVNVTEGTGVEITMPNVDKVTKIEFYNNSGNLPAIFNTSLDGKKIVAVAPLNFQSGPIKITTKMGVNWTQYPIQRISSQSPPVITSALTATASVGQLFSYTITATNSPSTFNYVMVSPFVSSSSVSFDSTSGLLSMTFNAVGTQTITISAANAGGWGSATLTITVAAPVSLVPVITSALTLTQAASNLTWTYTITATNNPISFAFGSISYPGTFVPLQIDPATGILSWNGAGAWTPGIYQLQLSASNAYGNGTAILVLTVTP